MLYNENIKKEYLDTLSESNRYLYNSKLELSYANEITLNKDLYDFTFGELSDTLYGLELPSINAVRQTVTVFRNYINWAAGRLYTNSAINPLANLTPSDLEKFVDHSKKAIITEEELRKLEDRYFENYQDKAIARAIFEGIYGKQMVELANLRKSDINVSEQTVNIRGGENPRTIKVSERLINFLLEADSEEIYVLGNGISASKAKEKKLVENEYIFRGVNNGRVADETEPAKYAVFYLRLKYLKEMTGLHYLTPKNISRSGMLYEGYKLYKESGKLDRDEYMELIKRFPVGKTGVNGEYYNLTGVKDVVNMGNIEEFYLQGHD